MITVNREKRISAIDALFHDFFIAHKINFEEPKRKMSIVIPSADEFLSQYSLDLSHNKGSQSFNRSNPSINKSEKLSFLNISNQKSETQMVDLLKKNSDSTNDVDDKKEFRKMDSLTTNTFALMFTNDHISEKSMNHGSSAGLKKSKFAN
jgi:hypothetical protein